MTTLSATPGTHTGDESQTAVLFDQNRTLTDPGTGGPRDKWDLNGNGNTTELVGQSTVAWTVLPAAGASISKLVKGALDADWTTNGLTNATFTGADSQVDYRLQITNPNATPLTNVTVYDLFPRVGDTAIGGSLAGTPRGSQWASLFQGMTSVPAGATVSYSTSINPCRPELFGGTAGQALPVGCTNSWTTTPPFDPRAVRAIKVTVPRVDPSATPTNIDFRMNAPALTGASDQAITNPGAVSNNNVAWSAFRASSPSASDSLLASEAPAVSVRRAAGQIGDRVWLDTNRNGLQDPGEPGVAGVTVELRDSAGNTVRDASNAPIRTTTDADGNYRFTVPLGTWSVAFLSVPAGYQLTASKVGSDDTIDSDATALGAATHTVTVTDPIRNGAGANVNLDLDAGLVTNSLGWEKVDATDAGHRLGGSEWTLTPVDAGNTPIGAPIAVTDCVAANAAACTGRDVDPGNGTFNVEGLTSGRWRLVETKAPAGYKLDPAPRYIEVSGATKFAAPIENAQQEAPTIPLTGGTGSFLFWATAGGLTALVALGLAAQRIRRRRAPLAA
ncbi:SdrD B-like domain-containing protein [Leucobacter sp. HNU]|uniref:SdrD B-like domain-containing protein n=1 Tax=Leucobacter sp. HNU TaxID=3236805 RepID=UPI003A805705